MGESYVYSKAKAKHPCFPILAVVGQSPPGTVHYLFVWTLERRNNLECWSGVEKNISEA